MTSKLTQAKFLWNCLVFLCGKILVSRTHKNFLSHFYIVKTVVLPLRNSANMPASRLPAPNGPDFTRLAPLFLNIKMAQKNFYELLTPISTHTERTSNFKKIVLVLLTSINKWGKWESGGEGKCLVMSLFVYMCVGRVQTEYFNSNSAIFCYIYLDISNITALFKPN